MIIEFRAFKEMLPEKEMRLSASLEVLESKGIEIQVVPKLNLLGHAQLEDFTIGSQCGGHGVCGADRLWIPQEFHHAFSTPTGDERTHIPADEIEAGWRLGCQSFALVGQVDRAVIGYFSKS